MLFLCNGLQIHAEQTDSFGGIFESIMSKAKNGDANAQCAIAEDYFFGKILGVTNAAGELVAWTKDEKEAVKWYKKAAEQDCAEAQYGLGVCYRDGAGVEKNQAEAVNLFRKAAMKGFASAEVNLGLCYADGNGVSKDLLEALKWWRKAADQGEATAQYNLGLSYDNGLGITQDFAEAIKWYRKAAEHGCTDAQLNLGDKYNNGQGVTQDYAEGVKWHTKAAERGNIMAQCNLAKEYCLGQGITQNYVEALRWYRKAAEQGYAPAQSDLGVMYFNGEGVTQDYVEAYKWYNLAASQGNLPGINNRKGIIRYMMPEQIAEGQRRAAAFVPRTETPSSDSGFSYSPANPLFTGTGFFITDDGYLISNYHVVKGAAKVRLLTGAGLLDASVVKVDAANDLALLKAVGRFAPLPIAASRTVKLGGTVATVGFPNIGLQGFSPKLAKGEIASLSGAADDPRYFQISVPVQPGNSGGALVEAHGNVVGIVAAKLDASVALAASGSLPENVNYAVKSSLLLSFLESVPDVAAKLKEPNTKDEAFEDVVKSAEEAAVLVLVY
jgi:TPR repeat protein